MTRAMKDSGIEWIGEIPEDWDIVKIKHLCDFYNGYAFDSSDFKFDGNCSVIRIGDIAQGTINLDTCAKVEADGDTLEKYALKKDDIVIALSGATIGKVGYIETTPDNTYINQRVAIIRSRINKLIYQWLNAGYISSNIPILSNSSAQPNISTQTIGNLFVSLPSSMPEQQKIADLLDEKCSHIDSVLEKTRASIEEYKQLKQSVITKAVTKGIRPNRPMKDSGIEWIGEIPEDWKVATLKHYITWKSEKGCPDETVLSLYRDYGVIPKDSRDDNHNVTSLDTSGYKVVDVGDFVINKMKAWQGSMAISKYRGIISPAYHICKVNSTNIDLMYFHYLLRNKSYLPEYTRLSTGMRVGQWDLGFDDFKNIPFIIPPMNEQIEIVVYLESKCSEIDTLITKKEQLIEELETYKKSLIYEYVTGKKEVC